MKNLFAIILIITTVAVSSAQELRSEDIIGKWIVVSSQANPEVQELQGLNEIEKKRLQPLLDGFLNAEFHFKENNRFHFQLQENVPEYMTELATMMFNSNWRINSNEGYSSISIGTEEDGYSIMEIIPGHKDRKTYFLLDETEFVLEVKKM